MTQPSRSKATSANSRQSPGARLWGKGWIYLPPGSNEQLSPKDSRSSAIDEGHIIGKRLRSNLNSEQTPSKIKKTDIDRINEIYRPSFENGAEKLHESKNPNNAVNTKRERESVIDSLKSSPVVKANDDVSTCSSLTELDDLLPEAIQEEVEVVVDTTPCPSPGQEENNRTGAKINHEDNLYTETCLRERVNFLEQQVTGLMVRKTEKETQYENTIETLLEQNYKQNARLDTLRACEGKKPKSTTNDDKVDLLIADLYAQDKEIRRLKSNLNEALRLNELLSPQSNKIYAIGLANSTQNLMRQIESSTILAADMLCQALSSQPLEQFLQEGTKALISDSIGNVNLLQSQSSAAFRAMIFRFIRDRIFYATDMWSSLHFESLMLGAYQSTLQKAVTPEFLERFHRAVLHHMLQGGGNFRDVFVIPHAKLLVADMMNLFRPFLHNALLQRSQHDEPLRTCLKDLFCDAIELRASYFPPPGTRYELLQFKPDTIYASQLMQIQPIPMENLKIPPNASKPLHIKLCVHGCIIEHTVSETSSVGFDRIRDWSQPFIEEAENKDIENILRKGKLASQKASVILEENVLN
ncbi:Hypothetical protein PENO1_081320 [Penicillium occitanis (nom. inval.)]|nr:Hypothetical protein PENO1_081320 [Penicillium occitanis (nom. inval.)]PCG94234.1 hypothetical protein PENOC_083770 [Penicillium occitanis (nom. inval.)]